MPSRDLRRRNVLVIDKLQEDYSSSGCSTEKSRVTREISVGQVRDWDRTPNFPARRKAGTLEPQALYLTDRQQSGTFIAKSARELIWDQWNLPGGPYARMTTWSGDLACLSNLYPEFPELIDWWELAVKARLAFNDERSWAAPLFLAEFGKSVSMIHDAATRLVNLAVAVKRFDFRRADKLAGIANREKKGAVGTAADSFSTNWLAYSYGWKPLIYDTYEAAKAIAHLLERLPTVTSRRTTIVRLSRRTSGRFRRQVQVSPDFVIYGDRTIHESRKLVFDWWVSDLPAYRAASFGLLNPASIAWELVPFSFVVDWFTPVGDIVGALDGLSGISIGNATGGVKRGLTFTVDSMSSTDFTGGCDATGGGSLLHVQRIPGMGFPSMVPTSFPIRSNLATSQVISALSLVNSVLRK